MPLRPKPEVENLAACPHGGPNLAELKAVGLTPETVVDFSVSANPFPPPPEVRKAINTVAINRYPVVCIVIHLAIFDYRVIRTRIAESI